LNLSNISKSESLVPEINEDGWYAQCARCLKEITPSNIFCPNCNQKQDWSWLPIKTKGE